MYFIVVYDVGVERIDSLRIYLKQYLAWVQNSVFEGELTKSQYYDVKKGISSRINEEEDNVLIYQARDQRFIVRESLGTKKADIGNII